MPDGLYTSQFYPDWGPEVRLSKEQIEELARASGIWNDAYDNGYNAGYTDGMANSASSVGHITYTIAHHHTNSCYGVVCGHPDVGHAYYKDGGGDFFRCYTCGATSWGSPPDKEIDYSHLSCGHEEGEILRDNETDISGLSISEYVKSAIISFD